ncbi:hypothetical protein D3227_15925 [Mesorhizobium waimense]|uniref:Uncharacterized protein n=1 Tax=Mesorhizobium waimense TaxID=1300307 RepID=A0A3A5KZ22_9HYPH|nr:hypothetical protein D3227_15925 [Mesorhizobium waimense]
MQEWSAVRPPLDAQKDAPKNLNLRVMLPEIFGVMRKAGRIDWPDPVSKVQRAIRNRPWTVMGQDCRMLVRPPCRLTELPVVLPVAAQERKPGKGLRAP